jgi:hypothetical protein
LGDSETQVLIVRNAGTTSTTISSITVSDSQFSVSGWQLPLVLAPGERAALTVVFTPTEFGWTGPQQVTFVDNSLNSTAQVTIAGHAVHTEQCLATPTKIAFGSVPVGETKTSSVVLKNESSSNTTVQSLTVAGRGFSISGPDMPMTLASGKSITLTITFAPKIAGLGGAYIWVSGPDLSIPLTGTGTTTGQLAIAPNALNFGSVDVGATTKASLSMRATGGSVIVSSASSGNSQFTIPGAIFPLTVNAGQTETLDVVFSPTQTGTVSSKLTFVSDASTTPLTESLSGVGIRPQYSVNLSWSPSTSAVAGYNIYRGFTVGIYSRLNSTLNKGTSYTDNTALSGSTYYYAATAVNSSGEESGYSSPLKVVIP